MAVDWTYKRVTWVSWFVNFGSDVEAGVLRSDVLSTSAVLSMTSFSFLKLSIAWFFGTVGSWGDMWQLSPNVGSWVDMW